jgi:AcrR family transcriptional regulator
MIENVIHEFIPHARQREAKSEAIIDAAMVLLAREGLEALTLARVARELDLVTTAIYRYFTSKDALLSALHRRAIASVHERFTRERARWEQRGRSLPPDVAALAQLIAAGRFYVALPDVMPEPFKLIAMMLADPRPLVDDDAALASAPKIAALFSEASALFDAAVGARAIEPAPSLDRAAVLWATLHGLTQLNKLRRVARDAPTSLSLSDKSVLTLLRGMGAAPEALQRAARAADKLTDRARSPTPTPLRTRRRRRATTSSLTD